jgi:hypothetical protein
MALVAVGVVLGRDARPIVEDPQEQRGLPLSRGGVHFS